jgi:hypothetical protein
MTEEKIKDEKVDFETGKKEELKDETVKTQKPKFRNSLLRFSTWLTGIIVSLMMGFAMIEKYIIIPDIPIEIVIVAGWAVIVTTVVNIIVVFFKKKD